MRHQRLIPALVLVLMTATLAVADPEPVKETRSDAVMNTELPSALERPDGVTRPERELSSMMVEIKQLLADQKATVTDLRTELSQTSDPEQKIELLQRIHQLKADTELDILRVQLRYAQQDGHLDTVKEIEEAIEFLTNPRPFPAPEPRPAPPGARN